MEAGARLGLKLTIPKGGAPDEPLVVILGWYGAQDRHVSKYSSLLEGQGLPTVRGVLPPAAVFSPVAWPRRRFAAVLLDYIQEVDPEGRRKIVFYAFSNGGAFVLEQLNLLVHTDPRYRQLSARVAGCILDSAPCYMHAWTGATAIGHGRSLPVRLLAALLFFLVFVVIGSVASPGRPQRFWRNMEGLHLGPKRLLLYSADDPLCDAAKVDELAASWRQRDRPAAGADVAPAGADLVVVRWERSQHVGHLLKNYREYTAAVFGFLEGIRSMQ